MNTGLRFIFSIIFCLISAAGVGAFFPKLMQEDMVANLDEIGLLVAPIIRFVDHQSGTITLNAGEPLEIRCEAFGSPAPVVYWTRNGKPVSSEKPESNWFEKVTNFGSRTYQKGATVGIMRIPCAKNSHAGIYTCVATNGHKQIERNVELVVKEGKKK